MSVASKPALSQSWRGMISRALANDLTMACCLWGTFLSANWWRWDETAISVAPPPATMEELRRARLTIMMASWRERSTSAMNCSAPPRRRRVHVLAWGQSEKRLKRSEPIWRSSNRPQVPKWEGWMSEQVDWMEAPVAWQTRSRSSDVTRPAQKMSRSAKYWVAKSPMGSLDRTTLAPVLYKASILLKMICHSASTMA